MAYLFNYSIRSLFFCCFIIYNLASLIKRRFYVCKKDYLVANDAGDVIFSDTAEDVAHSDTVVTSSIVPKTPDTGRNTEELR